MTGPSVEDELIIEQVFRLAREKAAALDEVDRLTTALAQVTAGALEADGSAGTLTGNLAVDMAAYATRLKARAEKAEADLRVLREGIEALADEWEREGGDHQAIWKPEVDIRALLRESS